MRTRLFDALFLLLVVIVGAPSAACGVVTREARSRFLASLGETSITVYPAVVRRGVAFGRDDATARRLAEAIGESRLARVAVSPEPVAITGGWKTNQAKMFRRSFEEMGAHVRRKPIATTYALLPELLMGTRGEAVGIHLYVTDSRGTPVYGFLMNSHHPAFASARLDTEEACAELAARTLLDRIAMDRAALR